MSSSKSKGEGDDSPSVNIETKQHVPTYLVQGLLSLMRIRDFLSLILTYPMRIGNEKCLKEWINEVAEFSNYYSEQMALLNTADDDKLSYEHMPLFDSLWRRVELLLSKRPLTHVGGLIPEDIIREVQNGGSFIFDESKLEEPTVATISTNKDKQLEQVPQSILDLATNLAVQQLSQTLTSDILAKPNIQNVIFSTRNNAENQTAVEKIKAALQIHASFERVLVFDISKNKIYEEFEVLGIEVRRWMQQLIKLRTEDDNVLLTRESERNQMVMSQRHKNLVILVDADGDKKLDLQKVGFPNKNAEVVVFVTTEYSAQQNNVLNAEVDLLIRTEDHVLPWKVFCKNIGSELVSSSSAIQRIAVQMVEECGGHLLAIVLVAKSLKNVTDVQLWKAALEKLCFPNISYIISKFEGVRKVIVNAFINFIWVDVIFERENPSLMQCLMVFKIQDLIKGDNELFNIWLSKYLGNSSKEAEHIVRELVDRSILLQFERYILLPVDIENIFEELLEKNSYENLKKGGLGLTEPPNVWDWHGAAQIELMHNNISKLPESPNCPKLEVLYLHGNANLTAIPRLFFQYMPVLHVLDLSYTGIQDLPSSIFKLAQLKTLYLRGCEHFKQLPPEIEQLKNLEKLDLDGTPITHLPPSPNFPKLRSLLLGGNLDLMEIPPSFFNHMPRLSILHLSCTSIHNLPSSFFKLEKLREFYLKDCNVFMELSPQIGQLRNLKKLDLDGTQITHLPKEIQGLIKLESLSLSFFGYHHNSGRGEKSMPPSSSAMIPRGFISELTHLEYLRIDVNPDNEWWHKNVEHVLAEIVGLQSLQTLDIYVPEVKLLKLTPRYVLYFSFIVGNHMQRIISRAPPAVEVKFKQSNRSLRFINGVDFPDEVKNILQSVQAFFLDRHKTVNNLFQFGLKNLQNLRVCILAECNQMQSILDGIELHQNGFFCLKFLTIFYMKNLRSIVEGPSPHPNFLSQLKFLALHTCPELTTIFTMGFIYNLSNLEELIVEDCPKVSSIISCQSSKPNSGTFLPRLRKLSLLYLPKLVSISLGLYIGRSLEKIGFYYCPKLESLSVAELSSKKLKVIRGEMKWWEALKWSEEEWGLKGRPDKFNQIFLAIDEEADVLTQLITNDVESAKSNEERDSGRTMFEPLQSISERTFKDRKQTLKDRKQTLKDTRINWSVIKKIPEGEETFDDGYIWRKYGQKNILGAKYPISYYGCIHRNGGGCLAKKKVQRFDLDPTMVEVTYKGLHTCTQASTDDLVVRDSTPTHSGKRRSMWTSNAALESFSFITQGTHTEITLANWHLFDDESVFTEVSCDNSSDTELTESSSTSTGRFCILWNIESKHFRKDESVRSTKRDRPKQLSFLA